ncbi:MAG: cytochrome c [Actinomycetota bacterium]|nr:cytochrome c [Actinomycetota bacterium]
MSGAALVLAASIQQKLGAATVILLLLGWLTYIAAHLRRAEKPPAGSEIELAPNRKPYFDDEALEGPRLDRALLAGLVLMVIVAVGLPVYWANEPGRQAGASRGFDNRAAKRGFILFQPADSPVPAGNVGKFGCGGCHGTEGQGGAATYSLADPVNTENPPRQVQWAAPALDTVALRYTRDQLKAVLVYGRLNTPMPPWGVLGGGPMNDQQITDLIAYLESIAIDPQEAQKRALEEFGLDGAKLFDGFCARCHTKGWPYGEPGVPGGGAFGPALTDGATLRQFPNVADHVSFVSEGAPGDPGSPYGKNYGERGVLGYEGGGMPFFNKMLTPEQIEAIVAYERGL